MYPTTVNLTAAALIYGETDHDDPACTAVAFIWQALTGLGPDEADDLAAALAAAPITAPDLLAHVAPF